MSDTPRTDALKLPSEILLLLRQRGVPEKVVEAILALGNHARDLERELGSARVVARPKCEACNGGGWVPRCCGEVVQGNGFDQPPECCGREVEEDCEACAGTGFADGAPKMAPSPDAPGCAHCVSLLTGCPTPTRCRELLASASGVKMPEPKA